MYILIRYLLFFQIEKGILTQIFPIINSLELDLSSAHNRIEEMEGALSRRSFECERKDIDIKNLTAKISRLEKMLNQQQQQHGLTLGEGTVQDQASATAALCPLEVHHIGSEPPSPGALPGRSSTGSLRKPVVPVVRSTPLLTMSRGGFIKR